MRRWPAWLAICVVALATAPAGAQNVVTSASPESVDVTIYRDPYRSASRTLNRDWLSGFALISETRRIRLPAGESELRFEGVADGLVPQSAIVTGFPDGIVERNRDAYLLSPATLLDRSLGRRVMIRRTSRETGRTREQEAVIRSGADGAVVLQTAEGYEALRCTGLGETLAYNEVPPGLSTRPTLSVRVRSGEPLTATITLSYIASGFDWQANYVANLSADGSRIDLFAWLTLASNDETTFVNADTQAVAGRPNRENVSVLPARGDPLTLRCWPQGRTHQIPREQNREREESRASQPMMDSPVAITTVSAEDLTVTGARFYAQQEDLGDLKLYRIPEPVTVAANSQKQVALFNRTEVPVEIVYRQRFHAINTFETAEVQRVMMTRNQTDHGLGLPLPAGPLVLFDAGRGRPILVGEGFVEDLAIGQEIKVAIGTAPGLRSELRRVRPRGALGDYELIVSNDGPTDLPYEAEIGTEQVRISGAAAGLGRRDGRLLWAVTVPAHGRVSLRYRARQDG